MAEKTLAIFWYSYTGGSRQMAQAALESARDAGEGEIDVRLLDARESGPEDLLGADGFLFVFPENLAAIAGEMKAFFDRCYYPCLGKLEGRPYGLLVCAGSDGENAVRQAERIARGWRLKQAAPSEIVCTNAQTTEQILAEKHIGENGLAPCREMGGALAAGISMGIF